MCKEIERWKTQAEYLKRSILSKYLLYIYTLDQKTEPISDIWIWFSFFFLFKYMGSYLFKNPNYNLILSKTYSDKEINLKRSKFGECANWFRIKQYLDAIQLAHWWGRGVGAYCACLWIQVVFSVTGVIRSQESDLIYINPLIKSVLLRPTPPPATRQSFTVDLHTFCRVLPCVLWQLLVRKL